MWNSLFALKLYFSNSVAAVGSADMQKSRLPATRIVYNFLGVWICQHTRKAFEQSQQSGAAQSHGLFNCHVSWPSFLSANRVMQSFIHILCSEFSWSAVRSRSVEIWSLQLDFKNIAKWPSTLMVINTFHKMAKMGFKSTYTRGPRATCLEA